MEGRVWGGTIPMWYAELQKTGKPIEGVTYVIASSAQETETTTVKVASGHRRLEDRQHAARIFQRLERLSHTAGR